MAITIDCNDPKTTANQVPCIQCISDSQLMVLLVIILNDYLTSLAGDAVYDLPEDSLQLSQDAACYGCLSLRKQKELLAVLLGSIAYGRQEEAEIANLQEKAKCIVCGDPHKIRSMLLRILCLIIDELAE